MLRFAHPFALLLLLALAAVALAARELRSRARGGTASSAARRRRRRTRPWVALAFLAPVLVVFALAEPEIRSGARRPTVLAVDESASIGARARTIERRWVARAGQDDCVSPCRVVRFAGTPRATPAGARAGAAVDAGATDLESGIAAAVGLAPAGGRVVVLSDGGQTQGDLLAAAAGARARRVAVDWVRLPASARPDAAITKIAAPTAVDQGDTVPLTLTVHSTVAGAAVLRVSSDAGAARSERIQLRVGDNPLLLFYTATRKGWHSFTATISLPGDMVPENNSLAAVTDVLGAPRVLSVGASGSPVPAMLSRKGLRVTSVAPAALPDTTAGYQGFDAVALDDVAATRLSAAQIAALASAVRSGGLGLLVIGGPHSFSLGRYATSGLQGLLPVASLVPGNLQRRNVAIELVLDHSGSMIDEAGGVPKIEMAHVAGTETASFLEAHKDQLGIVDFDIVPHLLIALQRIDTPAQERRIDNIIDGLQANGGTNIYLGLQAGFAQILKSSAPERHMILMTDGISEAENYKPLLARIKAAGISVATVALGSDADRPLLAMISKATGGHAYTTDDAKQLPKIFAKETQLSAKPVKVTGHLSVSLSSDSPVVRSLVGATLPALTGNVVTTLKSGAQADLLASDAKGKTDPALAEWQIGVGRVVTWTPGLGAPWGATWLKESSLFNDAVRWSDRAVSAPLLTPQPVPGDPGVLQVDLANEGSAGLLVGSINGTLTDAGGFSFNVDFAPAGPGLFQANVASFPPGVYGFTLTAQGSSPQTVSGEVALPYAPEYSPATAQSSPLGELAAQTAGAVLGAGDEQAVATPTTSLTRLLALLALVVFVLGVAGRMLPGLWRRRASGPGAANGDGEGAAPAAGAAQRRWRSSSSERALSSSSSSGSTEVETRT